jgi:hypothetical protein
MDRKEIIIVAVLLIAAFLIGFFIKRAGMTGNATLTGSAVQDIDNNYSWTKAICNGNKCIDVLIECKNGNVVSLRPMSDLVDIGTTIAEVNNSQLCN